MYMLSYTWIQYSIKQRQMITRQTPPLEFSSLLVVPVCTRARDAYTICVYKHPSVVTAGYPFPTCCCLWIPANRLTFTHNLHIQRDMYVYLCMHYTYTYNIQRIFAHIHTCLCISKYIDNTKIYIYVNIDKHRNTHTYRAKYIWIFVFVCWTRQPNSNSEGDTNIDPKREQPLLVSNTKQLNGFCY